MDLRLLQVAALVAQVAKSRYKRCLPLCIKKQLNKCFWSQVLDLILHQFPEEDSKIAMQAVPVKYESAGKAHRAATGITS